jgi:hypothetical protein
MGLILTIFGLFTNSDAGLYHRSLGININLWSGTGMLVFGSLMLWLAWKSRKTKSK